MADLPAPDRPAPDALPSEEDAPTVHQRVALDGEPDEVWELLTDPDLVTEWLGRPDDLELDRPGSSGRLVDGDDVEREVEVVESRPGRALRWTWWPAGRDDEVSTVEITLVPTLPGTEVHVVETWTGPPPIRASTAVPWTASRFVDVELALLLRATAVSYARR